MIIKIDEWNIKKDLKTYILYILKKLSLANIYHCIHTLVDLLD